MTTANLKLPSTDIYQKYQLLTKIGSGGMGDVFLGIQRGAVDFSRLVVIKRIHERFFREGEDYKEEHAKMFINEASLVASLNHPHIVKIYDFCMTGPSVCIVMEYVDGETLRYIFSTCRKYNKRIPLGLVCRLILNACDALFYAHHSTAPTGESRVIIHRDIGLHNLMLDSNGYLKVIDFGIAKSDIEPEKTSPGLIKGNPGYMAPDLFNEDTPDHRVDIYALGLCLWEMITLQRAYQFDNKATFGQIIQEIFKKELPPPSQYVPDLPEGIDDVVAKAIAKDRKERYQTVDQLARDLKKISRDVESADADPKAWFTKHFATRLKKRRAFGAQMLDLAKKANISTPSSGLLSSPHSGMVSMSGVTPTPSGMPGMPASSWGYNGVPTTLTSVQPEILKPSNLYKLIAVLVLCFIGCASFLYLLFFKESSLESTVTTTPTTTDNLVVHCEPPGSRLSVDGKELGLIGSEGLSLHVEPNKRHEIVLAKKGYRSYSLPFIGPSTGSKQIEATLIEIEPDPAAKPSESETAKGLPTMVFAVDNKSTKGAATTADNNRQRKPTAGRFWGRRKAPRKRQASVAPKEKNVPEPKPAATPPPPAVAEEVKKPPKPKTSVLEKNRRIPLPDDDERKIPLLDDRDRTRRTRTVD